MKKILLISFLFILSFNAFSKKYYWVGGSGQWTDVPNHWATTSGGSIFYNVIPSSTDTVYFDANSGSGTWAVQINGSLANNNCKDFVCTAATGTLTFSSNNGLNIYGSLYMASQFIIPGVINFKSTGNETVQMSKNGYSAFTFEGNGGVFNITTKLNAYRLDITNGCTVNTQDTLFFYGAYQVVCNINSNSTLNLNAPFEGTSYQGGINLTSGKLYTNGFRVKTGAIKINNSTSTDSIVADFSTSSIYLGGGKEQQSWDMYYDSTKSSINVSQANIIFNGPIWTSGSALGFKSAFHPLKYNIIIFDSLTTGTVSSNYLQKNGGAMNCSFKKVLFKDPKPAIVNIQSNNIIDTLIFLNKGGIIRIENSSTQTINDSLKIDSDCSHLTSLTKANTNPGGVVTLSSSKNLFVEYLTMSYMQTGGTGISTAQNIAELIPGSANNSWDNYTTLSVPTLYWIGGTIAGAGDGEWNNGGNWATTSGGTPQSCVPLVGTDVIFDQNSFDGTNQTVVSVGIEANCRNMTWVNPFGNPTYNVVTTNIYGSLAFHANMQADSANNYNFKSNNNLVNITKQVFWAGNEVNRVRFEGVYSLVIEFDVLDVLEAYQIIGTSYAKINFNDTVKNWDLLSTENGTFVHLLGGALIGRDFTSKYIIKTGGLYTYGRFMRFGRFEVSKYAYQYAPFHIDFSTSRVELGYTLPNDHAWDFYPGPATYVGPNFFNFDSCYIYIGDVYSTFGFSSRTPMNYNIVEFNGTYYNNINGGGSTFRKLFFSRLTPTITTISDNITVDTLVYLGKGSEIKLLASKTITINDSLLIDSDCGSFTSLHAYYASSYTTGRAFLSSSKNLIVSDLSLGSIETTGTGVSTSQNTVEDFVNNIYGNAWDNYTIIGGTTLYWIGGTVQGANDSLWENPNNWSFTSGGSPQSCIPNAYTNVIFDVNSFTPGYSKIVTKQSFLEAKCKNMTWTPGLIGNPKFDISLTRVHGSLRLDSTMQLPPYSSGASFIMTEDQGNHTVTLNGKIPYNLQFIDFNNNATIATWDVIGGCKAYYISLFGAVVNFLDTITSVSFRVYEENSEFNMLGGDLSPFGLSNTFTIYAGSLNTNGYNMFLSEFTAKHLTNALSDSLKLNLSTSKIRCEKWEVENIANTLLKMDSSHILIEKVVSYNYPYFYHYGNPSAYNVVEFASSQYNYFNRKGNTGLIGVDSCSFKKLLISDTLQVAKNYYIYSENLIDSLIVLGGYNKLIELEANKTQRINDLMVFNGNGCFPMQIRSTLAGTQANIEYPYNFTTDFIGVRDITIGTGAIYNAGGNSVNNGNNTGWIYSGSTWTTNPLGDTANIWIKNDSVALDATTFGEPNFWTWFDNTSDSIKYIDSTGAYSLYLDYGPGCNFTANFFINLNTYSNDTIYTNDTTECVTIELPNSDTLYSCNASGLTYNGSVITYINDSCISIPSYSANDTACIISCDTALGICDTTWIIFVNGPTINLACNDTIVYLDINGVASIDTSMVLGSISPMSLVDSVWLSKYSVTCASLPLDSVTVFVRDISGMIQYCLAYVSVIDTINPIISCSSTTVYLDINGQIVIDTLGLVSSVNDNCGIDSVWISDTDTLITCADIGNKTITVYVKDASNNTDSCTATLIVRDTINPIISCKPDTVYIGANGMLTIDTTGLITSFTDNCGVDSVWLSNNNTLLTCADTGVYNATIFVRDNSGNIDSCMSILTVLDTTSPVAICKDTTIYLDINGQFVIDSSFIDAGSNAGCNTITSIILSNYTYTCNDIGANSITLTVMDQKGRTSQCTATVNVVDSLAPQITCPNDTSIDLTGSCEFIIPNYVSNIIATDNCTSTGIVITQNPLAGTQINLSNTNNSLSQQVVITAIDNENNQSTCNVTINLTCENEIEIPQFYSPNGDGVNDTWIIKGINYYPNNNVSVYNRWGTLVYKKNSYNNTWGGEVNQGTVLGFNSDNILPSGTYYYIVDLDNGKDLFTGFVQIMK